MFEPLSKHRKILVTGPHRSGTTIAATMIAHDLESHGLVREELLWSKKDISRAKVWFYEIEAPVVVQAPFLADCCHQFPRVFVVYMMRRIEEIERSMFEHMKLKNGAKVNHGLIRYNEYRKYHATDQIPVSAMKYESWHEQKKKLLPAMYLELRYDDLRNHPLWVDRQGRKDFHVRQTSALDQRAARAAVQKGIP